MTEQNKEMRQTRISVQDRWQIIAIVLGLAAIGVTIFGIASSRGNTMMLIEVLKKAFTRTESTIESGFDQTHSTLSTLEENSLAMALGSKGDRPAWASHLQKAIDKAVGKHFLKVSGPFFVTTQSGEERLSVYIQREIQEVVKENPNSTFEELAAAVVEKLGITRVNSLAKDQDTSLNEMVAIVSGFAEGIRRKGEVTP